ncbi:hypothetical protein EYF80_010846 [Liparis tanakae]|uniref:Uncharacterized protein n=1 Tax=Liparis tanakae TaxID=230148 RepID=A0A4Z2ILI9_9TELE|nr:hypothetical protein EYF80_010846 [Liparis tanakae]
MDRLGGRPDVGSVHLVPSHGRLGLSSGNMGGVLMSLMELYFVERAQTKPSVTQNVFAINFTTTKRLRLQRLRRLLWRLLVFVFVVDAQVQPQVVQGLADGQGLLPPVKRRRGRRETYGDVLGPFDVEETHLQSRCWSSSCLCSRLLVSLSSASSLWVWRYCVSFRLASSSASFSWRFRERILWVIWANHRGR